MERRIPKYTLQDDIFVQSLLSGMEGAHDISLDTYLIGGGAVQVYSFAPEFLRPTLDVDLQTHRSVPKGRQRQWGHSAIERLEKRKQQGTYHHVRSGGEIEISVPALHPRFFLHLDVYTPSHYEKHATSLEEEFERKRPLSLFGTSDEVNYFVQSPEDLVTNKLKRPLYAAHTGRLCPEDEALVRQVSSGGIDDVDVGDLEERLNDTLALRNMGMEEITRSGFEKAVEMINHYKDQKDIYDILLLIQSDRHSKIFSEKSLVAKNAQQYSSFSS